MKMYILVNKVLSKSQRIPQACHAVVEFMLGFGQDKVVRDWVKNHRTIVCLQALEDEMISVMDGFSVTDSRYGAFIDDDIGDFFTAVVFCPMVDEEGEKWFGRFKLA